MGRAWFRSSVLVSDGDRVSMKATFAAGGGDRAQRVAVDELQAGDDGVGERAGAAVFLSVTEMTGLAASWKIVTSSFGSLQVPPSRR